MRFLQQLRDYFTGGEWVMQLYRLGDLSFRFRPYALGDRAAVLSLYADNAPQRFPADHQPVFEAFLDTNPVSYFVVESPSGEIMASCGVSHIGNFCHTLLYGLVAPKYHGMGIGSTMTAARLVVSARQPGEHLAQIYAVPTSLSFYQQFGFTRAAKWKESDGKDYPYAIMVYRTGVIARAEKILRERGHLIDPTYPIDCDRTQELKITRDWNGNLKFQLVPTEAQTQRAETK